MIPLSEELIQEQRRQDLAAEAEKRQLQARGQNPAESPTRTYYILLARLGDLLYDAGCKLKTRYGVTRYAGARYGNLIQADGADGFWDSSPTGYRGFGGGQRGNQLAADTGGTPTPPSGS